MLKKKKIVEDFRSVSGDVTVGEPNSKQPVTDAFGGKTPAQKYCATNLTKVEMQALRTLILCVSEMMMSASDVDSITGDESNQGSGDTIARLFASVDPPSLQRTLLVMSIEYRCPSLSACPLKA
jgi:hypothetical protein